jgi:hypothetical protein
MNISTWILQQLRERNHSAMPLSGFNTLGALSSISAAPARR